MTASAAISGSLAGAMRSGPAEPVPPGAGTAVADGQDIPAPGYLIRVLHAHARRTRRLTPRHARSSPAATAPPRAHPDTAPDHQPQPGPGCGTWPSRGPSPRPGSWPKPAAAGQDSQPGPHTWPASPRPQARPATPDRRSLRRPPRGLGPPRGRTARYRALLAAPGQPLRHPAGVPRVPRGADGRSRTWPSSARQLPRRRSRSLARPRSAPTTAK